MAAISQAYELYKQQNGASSLMEIGHVTPYLNYIRVDTAGQLIDHWPGSASLTCGSGNRCVRLANGTTLFYYNSKHFGGTADTNAVYFFIDPDSTYSGSASDGPSKSLQVWLYYNGRLTTRCCILPNTTDSDFSGYGADPNQDPIWFRWN